MPDSARVQMEVIGREVGNTRMQSTAGIVVTVERKRISGTFSS